LSLLFSCEWRIQEEAVYRGWRTGAFRCNGGRCDALHGNISNYAAPGIARQQMRGSMCGRA